MDPRSISVEGERRVVCSIAAVIRREDGSVLVVRRPLDDDSLPGFWGLPAISIGNGDLPGEAVRRIGRTKLATELEPVRLIGADAIERSDYRLVLLDIEARIADGAEPDLGAASGPGTLYTELRWTDDLEILRPAADAGSLCCRILLRETGGQDPSTS